MKLLTAIIAASIAAAATAAADPVVRLRQGTYTGVTLPTFSQSAFLGVPYASKPERFTPSSPIITRSNAKKNATAYGPSCPAYGSDTRNLIASGAITLGEDCLSLNVIRPEGVKMEKSGLPVLVWIYGGGWAQGATADPRYNISYVVQQSAAAGHPVLGVSINYRTAAFGFLVGEEVLSSGNTNLGLRDQRSALRWIQSNIAQFGGDPKKVTIWGESAGAYSVGSHLLAYNARDDSLFRAAILESGTAVGPPWNGTAWYQPLYDTIASRTNCSTATSTLSCLCALPYDTLYANADVGYEWFATIDGAFMTDYPTTLLKKNRFIKVPLLLGTNTDEGTSFGATGVNTNAQAVAQLVSSKRWVLTKPEAEEIWALYSPDPAAGSPYGWGNTTWLEYGTQYKRYSSVAGDLCMEAPRRHLAQTATKAGVERVYSYRFDAPLYNTTTKIGIGHFQDIPFVMSNTQQTVTPLGSDPQDLELGHVMARMWTSFVAHLDPNRHGVEGVPTWPKYGEGKPRNLVLRTKGETYVEMDDYRQQEMARISEVVR